MERLLGCKEFTFTPISGGHSGARTYQVRTGGEVWAVKVFPAKPRLEEWYALLGEIGEPHLVSACACEETEGGMAAVMSPWIEGESLSGRLASHPDEAEYWGGQAAALVRTLHAQPVDEGRLCVRYVEILDRAIASACEKTEGELAFLPHAAAYCACLKKLRSHLRLEKVCLLHKDIHPGNFIVREGELYLIDFENGGLGECEQDFVRLLDTFEVHNPFLASFLRHYWGGDPPKRFWERCLAYRVLAFVQESARGVRRGERVGSVGPDLSRYLT